MKSGGVAGEVKRQIRRGDVLDDAAVEWLAKGRIIELDRPRIVGVLNVTPDSFSDGGNFFSAAAAIEHAARLLDEGADILDVGGESTRPQGATPVSVKEELDRVVPIVGELAARFPSAILSVDTVKSKVADEALKAGAHIINDVSGFRLDSNMVSIVAESEAGVVLMHSRGGVSEMATYAEATYSDDPVADVVGELLSAVEKARSHGVRGEAIVLDPGLGFSKMSSHSTLMLRELGQFIAAGYPVLIGASRKRFIGELSGVQKPDERVHGSVAAAVVALVNGAMLFRVHDVRATREALDVAWGILTNGGNE